MKRLFVSYACTAEDIPHPGFANCIIDDVNKEPDTAEELRHIEKRLLDSWQSNKQKITGISILFYRLM